MRYPLARTVSPRQTKAAMREASKTNLVRPPDFSEKFLRGRVLDIGAGDDLVCSWAEGFDIGDGDANTIDKYFAPNTFDSIHSSHCLEHMTDPVSALAGWWSILKPGGFLIIVVPDEDLYEQTCWPSAFNGDHTSTFRLDRPTSWSPVSYELRSMCTNLPNAEVVSAQVQDANYDYSLKFPPGVVYRRKKPRHIKWTMSIAKRLPFVGQRAKELLQRKLIWHGFPVDQTLGNVLAQIQIIVRKLP
jgi:SAM-dependent methyltransferase